ncbi:MAG: molybdopterin-binding protein [Deinococcales bacterium]
MTETDKATITSGRDEHSAAGPKKIKLAILTISDTRNLETDSSGRYLSETILAAGHELVGREIIKDDKVAIKASLKTFLASEAQVILSSGGTGIAGRDYTIPVVESLILKALPGFGELFRMLSYQEIGGAAMLSRATAGLAKGGLIFALPGSSHAVKLAWEKLIAPELSHLVFEVLRHAQEADLQG